MKEIENFDGKIFASAIEHLLMKNENVNEAITYYCKMIINILLNIVK